MNWICYGMMLGLFGAYVVIAVKIKSIEREKRFWDGDMARLFNEITTNVHINKQRIDFLEEERVRSKKEILILQEILIKQECAKGDE